MPPKKAKKSGSKENGGGKKKTKAPAYLTDESLVSPFGFAVDDVIVTPLGLRGTVLGVKPRGWPSVGYAMYVRYEGTGRQMHRSRTTSGYRREAEVAHVWRDVNASRRRSEGETRRSQGPGRRAPEAKEATKVAAESSQSKPKKTKGTPQRVRQTLRGHRGDLRFDAAETKRLHTFVTAEGSTSKANDQEDVSSDSCRIYVTTFARMRLCRIIFLVPRSLQPASSASPSAGSCFEPLRRFTLPRLSNAPRRLSGVIIGING